MSKDALEALLSVLDNWAAFFTLLVVIGVGGELVIHVMQSRSNKKLIALQNTEALAQEAEIARMKKDSASFELGIAKANKGSADALERAAKAEENLGNAKKSAAEANERAANAEQKAGSFQLQIAQANERAANAELELAKIRSPRTLNNVPQMIASLKQFAGTEYMFSAVFADEEALTLLKQLDVVLQSAGWRRLDSAGPSGIPTISIPLTDRKLSVVPSLITGVQISASSIESEEILRSKSLAELPTYIRAGILLNATLAANIAPKQELPNRQFVNVKPGGLTAVQIDVGKKP